MMANQKRKSFKAIDADDEDEEPLFHEDDVEDSPPPTKRAKKELKAKAPAPPTHEGGTQVNQEGEKYVALGKNRRVTLRKFNGKPLIDIREFYVDKDDKQKPGKKGISLSPEQWEALKQCLPAIDDALAAL
ncbi:PC4-domain-containing protein [Calocera viscosa TUFC12733]|uniref:PC4-domain-containing protein n=1 Tax=Calocera viscosa (strain TUFC12733) TaxID=1330018 RepID=A0A167PN52_CALVF|nr:PC4-domain-containing protein [Calocera viscosa TUFC12733]